MVAASVLGMVGAAMFLGDCVITPAISVLSAAEGLEVASPSMKTFVLPIALVLIAGVFVLQRAGSGKIGVVYGPVMLAWFAVLAVGGVASLARTPSAAAALSPHWAVLFFVRDPLTAFLALGAVILAVTGAEALYADLGHFGRRAITRSWLFVVLPALLVAYLGEAAAVLRDPGSASDPFYAVVPGWATIPVVVLATMATVIASEAVIAGAFTVLHQAAGLGLFPELRTRHTSRTQAGEIYIPSANWALAVTVLGVVVLFRSSDKLSSAYGVAVASTFLVTITLLIVLQRLRPPAHLATRLLPPVLLVVLVAFFASTLPKVLTGGWAPVSIGAVLLLVMTTWWSGQRQLARARSAMEETPEEVVRVLLDADPAQRRSEGSSVFLTQDRGVVPVALQTVVDSGYVVAEHLVLLSWHVEDTPGASAEDSSVAIDTFGGRVQGVLAVEVTLGYRERLDVVHVLEQACEHEPEAMEGVDPDEAWYFVSDPIPRLARDGTMALWRQRLFLLVDRLASDRVQHLRLPRDRTIVIGREFDL